MFLTSVIFENKRLWNMRKEQFFIFMASECTSSISLSHYIFIRLDYTN